MNKQKNGRKFRLKPVILAGLTAAALSVRMPSAVLADAAGEKKPSLTIDVVSQTDGRVEGAELSVYQIAALDGKNLYRATENFKGLNLDFNNLTVSDIAALDRFAKNNMIPADRSEVTDQSGSLKMDDLHEGIYLVRLTDVDNKTLNVEVSPFLVALPMEDKKGGWIYGVTAQPKTVTSTKATEPETTDDPTVDPNDPTVDPNDPTKDPDEPTVDPDDPTKDPHDPTKDPNDPTKNPENPTTGPTTEAETVTPGGGSHGGGGNRPGGGGGGGNPTGPGMDTTIIEENRTPLASFPGEPAEPDLVLIEDAPVPLAALPQIPKLGDMGAFGYLAGLLVSLALGLTAVKKRRDYKTGESD